MSVHPIAAPPARREPLLAPSLLASDLANIQATAHTLAGAEADWLHFDVMDGRFVPNISFGLPILEALKPHAKQPIDVHLMIEEPQNYLAAFREAGATNLTVHYEACPHLHRVVQQIKALGCVAGVALNPATPAGLLVDIAPVGPRYVVCKRLRFRLQVSRSIHLPNLGYHIKSNGSRNSTRRGRELLRRAFGGGKRRSYPITGSVGDTGFLLLHRLEILFDEMMPDTRIGCGPQLVGG
ncbi:MAG: ribulose-phosphate 3-epimerase [Hymenobacter sp.]|nr:MAG: ribulose-phosphate 3-epimerase [Hymenobacter sp.]